MTYRLFYKKKKSACQKYQLNMFRGNSIEDSFAYVDFCDMPSSMGLSSQRSRYTSPQTNLAQQTALEDIATLMFFNKNSGNHKTDSQAPTEVAISNSLEDSEAAAKAEAKWKNNRKLLAVIFVAWFAVAMYLLLDTVYHVS